jgi:ketosteroid isomerase-like protein
MKQISLLTLLIFYANTGTAQVPNADEKTKSFLAAFRASQTKGMLDGAPEKIQAYYHDNIRLMVESQRTMIGKSNVVMYHQAFSRRFNVSAYSLNHLEVLDCGQMVLDFGTMSMSLNSRVSGKTHDLKGKYVAVWERDSEGGLLLITFGWNYSHDLDVGNELRFPDVPVVDVCVEAHVPVKDNISFELAALNGFMETVITQHDAATWSRFYSDDAVSFAQRHPPVVGRKAIDTYITDHVAEFPVFENLAVRNDRIDNLGAYVIEYASHIAVWRAGESSGVGRGKDLRVWRREPDGSLKIFRHIGMYD